MITSFFSSSFTGRDTSQFINPHRPEQITSPPAKVSVVSPANGAVNQQLDIYLSWAKPSMARRYDVYFGSTAGTIALVSEDETDFHVNPLRRLWSDDISHSKFPSR